MIYLLACLALVLCSCGGISYTPPKVPTTIASNSAIVDQPRETFWRAFIPTLSTQFFVINNLDKETGLINLSFGGDPQQFIDCGQVVLRNYWQTDEFPGALPNRKYDFQNGYGVYWASRQLSLDGRMNVIVQEIDPQKSSVTVNARYNRRIAIGSGGYTFSNTADSVAFNYGEYGNFGEPHPFSCRANGALEQSILAIAKSAASPK